MLRFASFMVVAVAGLNAANAFCQPPAPKDRQDRLDPLDVKEIDARIAALEKELDRLRAIRRIIEPEKPELAEDRKQRALRWEVEFRFFSAAQYLTQLDSLGCYLAFPDKEGKLMFIRNLKERPARPRYEDIKAMNRIYFVDQRSDNEAIADELKLTVIPAAIVIAMPRTMEDRLVELEAKYRGRKEEDIKRTRFLVTFAKGNPSFKVIAQDLKPNR
jgi:Protein of unknown function (DUF1192)